LLERTTAETSAAAKLEQSREGKTMAGAVLDAAL
jgi:hypothetical protein